MIEHLFSNIFVDIDLRCEIGILRLDATKIKGENNRKSISDRGVFNGLCLHFDIRHTRISGLKVHTVECKTRRKKRNKTITHVM